MGRPSDLAQWNMFKIMTACCQITCAIPWLPCEQLPYPPEHPLISRMRQRDKLDLPLPVLSYKYLLLRYSFSILSFCSPKSSFLAATLPKDFKNFSNLLHQSSKSSILFLAKKWPSTSSFLRSVYHPFSFRTFAVLLFICDSFYWVPFFLLFVLSFSKLFRIWPIRLQFLPINPTSNVSAR